MCNCVRGVVVVSNVAASRFTQFSSGSAKARRFRIRSSNGELMVGKRCLYSGKVKKGVC